MRRATLLLCLLALGFAPAPFLKPAKSDDLKAIQGEWIGVFYGANGNPPRPATPEGRKDIIEGANVTVMGAGRILSEWNMTLDPTAKPKRMLLVKPGYQVECIYKLEGDTLTVSYHNGRGARPAGFAGGPGIAVEVFQRAKR